MSRLDAIKEVRAMDAAKREAKILELQSDLVQLQADLRLGKLKNTNEIKSTKRQIARLKTVGHQESQQA